MIWRECQCPVMHRGNANTHTRLQNCGKWNLNEQPCKHCLVAIAFGAGLLVATATIKSLRRNSRVTCLALPRASPVATDLLWTLVHFHLPASCALPLPHGTAMVGKDRAPETIQIKASSLRATPPQKDSVTRTLSDSLFEMSLLSRVSNHSSFAPTKASVFRQ